MNFFPLREFCKNQNKQKSKGAISAEYSRWIRTSQLSYNNFTLSSKKQAVLHYPDDRLFIFCWLILVACCWVLLSVGLNGSSTCRINHLVFWKELIIENSLPIPPYPSSPSLEEYWPLVYLAVVHFAHPMVFQFHIIVQYLLFIAHHSMF